MMTMDPIEDTTNGTTGETASNTAGQSNAAPQKTTGPKPADQKSLAERLADVVKPITAVVSSSASTPSEPVILEEHIVEKNTTSVPPILKQAPAEDVGLVFSKNPPESLTPSTQPLASQTQIQANIPNIVPDMIPPSFPLESKKPDTQLSSNIRAVADFETPKNSGSINADIEKILREVKLPERRDFKAGADPKKGVEIPAPTEAKDLAGMVVKPPENAQAASAQTSHPNSGGISSVHTLKDDLQHAVKDKKVSLVRAVSLEQDKKRTEMVEEDFGRRERRKRISGILFASLLLFFLGGAALFGVYIVMMSHAAPDTYQTDSMVFAEQSLALPLNNATAPELKRRIAAQRQAQTGSAGSITSIIPIYQNAETQTDPTRATTVEFLRAIGANAPDNLLRSVGPNFFFGLHIVDKTAPVLVIPITNYDRAFAGMLEWEHSINADLSPAFTPVPSVTLDANGIPSERIFTDDVMRNYDVRQLKDDSGQIQLYYSFPSPNLLIIAESQYSFSELLSRLQAIRKL